MKTKRTKKPTKKQQKALAEKKKEQYHQARKVVLDYLEKVFKKPKQFPLSFHPSGRWQKKIDGKVHFFGRWGRTVKKVLVPLADDPDNVGHWREAVLELAEDFPHLVGREFKQALGVPIVSRKKRALAEEAKRDVKNALKRDIDADRPARPKEALIGPDLDILDLCSLYLDSRQKEAEAKRKPLAVTTYNDYKNLARIVREFFGNEAKVRDIDTPDKLQEFYQWMARQQDENGQERFGLGRMKKLIVFTRGMFKKCNSEMWCFLEQDERDNSGRVFTRRKPFFVPVPDSFRPPAQEAIDDQRKRKLFSTEEVRKIIVECRNIRLRAMVLLGLNCAWQNVDFARLSLGDIGNMSEDWRGLVFDEKLNDEGKKANSNGNKNDAKKDSAEEKFFTGIDAGWFAGKRPKTGMPRASWLWPETQAVLIEVLEERITRCSPNDEMLLWKGGEPHYMWRTSSPLFITKHYQPYIGTDGKCPSIAHEFRKLLEKAFRDSEGQGGYREGIGIAGLRSTHRTITEALTNTHHQAVRLVMGHATGTPIERKYVWMQQVDSIQEVCEYVREELKIKDVWNAVKKTDAARGAIDVVEDDEN